MINQCKSLVIFLLYIPIKSFVFYHALWSGCLPWWFRMEILGGMIWMYKPNNCWYVFIDLNIKLEESPDLECLAQGSFHLHYRCIFNFVSDLVFHWYRSKNRDFFCQCTLFYFAYSNPVLLPESIIRGHLSYSCQVLHSYTVGRLWVAGFDLANILTIHIINKKWERKRGILCT